MFRKAAAANSKLKFKRPKPLDGVAVLAESYEHSDSEVVAKAILNTIISRAATILHTHNIQSRALEQTAEETVVAIMQAVRLRLCPRDPGEHDGLFDVPSTVAPAPVPLAARATAPNNADFPHEYVSS